jgi:hypothetical protein
MFRRTVRIIFAAALLPTPLVAQESDPLVAAYPADHCPSYAEWNMPQHRFRLHGNTYYVGTLGLSALLIPSPESQVLIDGGCRIPRR